MPISAIVSYRQQEAWNATNCMLTKFHVVFLGITSFENRRGDVGSLPGVQLLMQRIGAWLCDAQCPFCVPITNMGALKEISM